MKTQVFEFFILLLACQLICSQPLNASWNNWVLPNWEPSWDYNKSWTIPTPPVNFTRNVIGNSVDPFDNYFQLRPNHYLWSTSDALDKVYCGLESYLDQNFMCQRNPYYWNLTGAAILSECFPTTLFHGIIKRCVSFVLAYGGLARPCCYEPIPSSDLVNFYSASETFPLGA